MKLPQSDIFDASAKGLQKYKGVNFPSWDSLAEAIEFADKGKRGSDFSASSREEGDWSGTPNWPYMLKVAENGWTKGRALVAASLETIFSTGAATLANAAAIDYDIAGHYPDTALASSGETFAMINAGDLSAEKPVVKLVVNITASAGIKAKHLANRGAAVAALVDQIESAGHSCEIHAVRSTVGYQDHFTCECVVVKRAGERLGVDEIAFGLGHPSMLRRVCFALMENDPFTNRKGFAGGYGMPRDIPADALPADAIYFEGIDNDRKGYDSPENAMKLIRGIYEKQAEAKGLAEVAE